MKITEDIMESYPIVMPLIRPVLERHRSILEYPCKLKEMCNCKGLMACDCSCPCKCVILFINNLKEYISSEYSECQNTWINEFIPKDFTCYCNCNEIKQIPDKKPSQSLFKSQKRLGIIKDKYFKNNTNNTISSNTSTNVTYSFNNSIS